MAMAILIGFGFPALLFFTLVEPAGAAMIGTVTNRHSWDTHAPHHSINVAVNEVDPMVCLLLVAGAIALVTMLMIQQQLNRRPTAAELNAQMSPISDDDDDEIIALRPGFGTCFGPIDYRTWFIGENDYNTPL
jgi:hypothetical protein